MRQYRSDEQAAVVAFLLGDSWPFHAGQAPTTGRSAEYFDPLHYESPSVETWWIDGERSAVGLVRLFDLGDDTAMFDLRLRQSQRGRGTGTGTVRWLTERIFTTYACTRIEATTRQDNLAMRRALLSCGYVKESHYRASWPAAEGTARHDAVGYAILKHDWIDGTTTPVEWDDEPARWTTPPELLFQLDLDENGRSTSSIRHLMVGSGPPGVRQPGDLGHRVHRPVGVGDDEDSASHGHDDVVELVTMGAGRCAVLTESPFGDANPVVVDGDLRLCGFHDVLLHSNGPLDASHCNSMIVLRRR